MCDLFSWGTLKSDIESLNKKKGDVLFLDDEMMQSVRVNNPEFDDPDSVVGHSAIAAYFHIGEGSFDHHEHPSTVPRELANAIMDGRLRKAIRHLYGDGCSTRREPGSDGQDKIVIERVKKIYPDPKKVYCVTTTTGEDSELMHRLKSLGVKWASGDDVTELSYFGTQGNPHYYCITVDQFGCELTNYVYEGEAPEDGVTPIPETLLKIAELKEEYKDDNTKEVLVKVNA